MNQFSRTVGAGTTQLSPTDFFVNVDTSAGAVTLILPKITTLQESLEKSGSFFSYVGVRFVDISNNASVNNITVATADGDNINDAVSVVLDTDGVGGLIQLIGTEAWALNSNSTGGSAPSDAVIKLGNGIGSSVRIDNSNDASGNISTVSGGYGNTACSLGSTVSGGFNNTASGGYYATVSGGYDNLASGSGAFIGSGRRNVASGDNSVINGGSDNVATDDYALVGGGICNTSSFRYASIGGGEKNVASAFYATVSGGYFNRAICGSSVVSGGYANSASGFYTTISGGYCNSISSDYAGIGSGQENVVSSEYGFIGGGCGNISSGLNHSVVVGGLCNFATGRRSFIGGGTQNLTSEGTFGANGIASGAENTVSSDYSFIGGGWQNSVSSDYSFIGGGSQNSVSACYSVIVGGWQNTASAYTSTISGGYCNCSNVSARISSITGGAYAVAYRWGQRTFATARFNVNGDAQYSEFIFSGTSIGDTPKTLSLAGDSNSQNLNLRSGFAMGATINIFGLKTDGTQAAHYVRKVAIQNVGGTAQIIGSVSTIGTDMETQAGYDVLITADNGSKSLVITVYGVAGETIRWIAHVSAVETAIQV
jgi:hypothetical protein